MYSWPDPTEEELLTGSEYEIFVEGMSTMVFSQPFVMKIRDAWQVDYQPGNITAMDTSVPTLILNGGEDHVCLPGYAQKLSESFENSYCYIFDGIAHSPIDAGECAALGLPYELADLRDEEQAEAAFARTGHRRGVHQVQA